MASDNENLIDYTIHLGDNALILAQRLGEWCGHGPVLEQDIALTNISLDLLGQARMLFQYAAELKGAGATEDSIAYMRNEHEYYNCLLVEQPNGNFGTTILRQFLFDVFNYYNYQALEQSSDTTLAAIAARSIKEVSYHLRYSSEWVVRLGDGTEESHVKMQEALDQLWMFSGELFEPHDRDKSLVNQGIAPDLSKIQAQAMEKIKLVIANATLKIPENSWMQSGGKSGKHSEYLGHVLTELQYMQRTYPQLEW